MSERYPGGIITKSTTTPTGPYQNGTAPGIWTLDQQLQFQQQGIWPTAGLVQNYIEDVFSTYLYAGNNTARSITNGIDLSTYGGMVWIKDRTDAGTWNVLVNSVNGPTKQLYSNSTNAQFTDATAVTSFNSNGFSLGADGTNGYVNYNFSSPTNYVSWTFRKQAKFFDVVTWTGDGTTGRTIAHNLGSVPGCIMVKCTSTTGDWGVYHTSLGATQNLKLNLANAAQTSVAWWNNTSPTSTDFTLYSTPANSIGATYVAYLFASNAGGFGNAGTDNVITCGSYTGVTYPNSLEVTIGFEPQFVIIKNSNTASSWTMWDTMRGMSVVPAANTAQSLLLEPNTSAAESNQPGIFPTATGFVVKNGLTSISSPSDKMIYIAIRRGPMATPTDATKVFAPNNGASSTSGQTISTTFPVDLIMSAYQTQGYVGLSNDRLRGISNTNTAGTTPALQTSTTDAESAFSATNPWFIKAWNNSITRGSNGADPVGGIVSWLFGRAPGFFDVVCYNGDSGGIAENHNLTVVPELIINKSRNAVNNWFVYRPSASATYGNLNTTAAFASLGSQVATASTYDPVSYASGTTYVSYLFATLAGVSKVGSYTGNGTTQTINCGFGAGGARFVLIKRTDSTGGWYVYDTARGMTTLTDPYLLMNSTAAEVATLGSVTTVSTGFALNSSILAAINVNAGTYIFLAIA